MPQYEFPWRFLPAHVFLHVGIFCSAIVWIAVEPGEMQGMNSTVHHFWLAMGLIAAPIMWISYHIIFIAKSSGRVKYIAVISHFLANFMALFYLLAYLLSDWNNVLIGDQDLPAYIITITAGTFLVALVVNDIISIVKLERMATRMMIQSREKNG
jgi:hypothetical protein